ncbi:MAG: hypothetical protein RB296_01835 [Acidobacteriota bacterium]|jgi:hypothetical protein|nr:hypothetical protein [Acidobacteriota bacterium]
MRIDNIQFEWRNGCGELSARVNPARSRRGEPRVWFRFPVRKAPARCGDVMVCAFLVPCMQAGEDLEVAAPVSAHLFEALPRIQDILLEWYPGFRRSRVTGHKESDAATRAERTAACFSAGVDSLFTQLDPELQTDSLVLVHGFENPVERRDLLNATLRAVEPMAVELKKPVMVVETNLRSLVERGLSRSRPRFRGNLFGFCWMGAFLAAIGHCLQSEYGRFVIPASLSLDQLCAYGSHPHLDPLWSSHAVQIIHHGAGAGRLEKIRRIARAAPRAVGWLQVCESNPPARINCGDCDKCLRTRLALRLAGACEPNPAFPQPPNWERWPLLADRNRWEREYTELLRWSQAEKETVAVSALQAILSPPPWWKDLYRHGRNLARRLVRRYFPGVAGLLRRERRRVW